VRRLALPLAVLLAGCGSLRVEVAALDPREVEREVDRLFLRERLNTELARPDDSATQPIVVIERQHFEALEVLREAFEAERGEIEDQAEIKVLNGELKGVDKSWERAKGQYARAKGQLDVIHRQVVELAATLGLQEAKLETLEDRESKEAVEAQVAIGATRGALADQLRRQDEIVRLLQERMKEDMADAVKAAPEASRDTVREAANRAVEAAQSSLRSIIGDHGIQRDRYAFAVANADEHLWATRFNRVLGTGRLGNLNVAIKMVDIGDFTLKGLSFDPSDVARMAGKVTSQALVLASQIAGVPVTQPTSGSSSGSTTTGTSGAALATSSRTMAAAERDAVVRAAQAAGAEDGLLSVAKTVLREWSAIEGDDKTRRAAGVKAIQSSLAANQQRINMEGWGTSTPAATPTPTPTGSPTPAPTGSPTPSPTASPSPSPTVSPTPSPTASPSPSPAPTASPSGTPPPGTSVPPPDDDELPAPTPAPTPVPSPTPTSAPTSTAHSR
jgi:hypothetical protein